MLGPALGLEIRGQFGAYAFHVRLALKGKLPNELLVLDVRRIFRKREILDVELIFRRLRRGFLAELSGRLGCSRVVPCVLIGVFLMRGLKKIWDISHRRDKH